MPTRLLFLCAAGSSRALLAASLLQDMAASRFEVWSTPPREAGEQMLIEQILHEQAVALLSPDHLIQPTFGLRWDEGIILCSGGSAT